MERGDLYKAFLSYSHDDRHWAAWLHRSLEAYRVPRGLIDTNTLSGTVPPRVRPIFRDRDDMSSASDLSNTIRRALAESENLIVLCSPDAAASRWVNKEIREFAQQGRIDHIFCVIVGGDSDEDCFPAALAEIGVTEPLAADLRRWADGKQLAKLKLIAGLLGLPLDQLRRRDLRKRRRLWTVMTAAGVLLATIVIIAVSARISAEQRRNSGESLVAYKLTELRTLLEVKEDPTNLTRLQQWDATELTGLIATAESVQGTLSASALARREDGIALWKSGHHDEAMGAFLESWALMAEEFHRDRENRSAFFELGQAEYWIGRVHLDQGDLESASIAFTAYAEITRQLIQLEPENAEWVLEMSYALTNLGNPQLARGTGRPEHTLKLMQSALEYNQIALILKPDSFNYRSELGQSLLNLADAQRNVCDLEGALHSQAEGIILERGLLQGDVSNPERMLRLAYALSGYAGVRRLQGETADAVAHLERSLELIETAAGQFSLSRTMERLVLERKLDIARFLAMQRRYDEAGTILDAMADSWRYFRENQPTKDFRTTSMFVEHGLLTAQLAGARGDKLISAQILLRTLGELVVLFSADVSQKEAGYLLTRAVFHYWQVSRELPPERYMKLLPNYESRNVSACREAVSAMQKAIMLGSMERASDLSSYLQNKGYREASFVRLCKTYDLCNLE